jgi:hypothetical protein
LKEYRKITPGFLAFLVKRTRVNVQT